MVMNKEQAEALKKQIYAQISHLPKFQQDEIKKQIDSMNPAQLEEWVKQVQGQRASEINEENQETCLFCNILEGKIKGNLVYDDKNVQAILDINPASEGHVLVYPKFHKRFLSDLSKEEISDLFNAVKKISKALVNALDCKGVNTLIAEGKVAGQRVPHLFVNLIPRYEKDSISFEIPRKKAEEATLDKLAGKISSEVSKLKEKEKPKKTKEEIKKENEGLKKLIENYMKRKIP